MEKIMRQRFNGNYQRKIIKPEFTYDGELQVYSQRRDCLPVTLDASSVILQNIPFSYSSGKPL